MRRTTTAYALLALALPMAATAEAAPPPDSAAPRSPSPHDSPGTTDVPVESSPPDVPSSTTDTEPPAAETPSHAETPGPAPARPPPSPALAGAPANGDGSEDAVPLVLPARDTIGGHLMIGANVGVVFPFGSVESGTAESDLIGPGLWLGGDILYGVSRTLAFGAYGEVATPSGQNQGSGQDFTTIAAGPMVRYHLVQGVRFDPWLSAGAGFRRTSNGSNALTGIDWMRLQVGGDWYPASNFGFGPLLELTLGTFVDSTNGNLGTKAVNAQFVLGGRIVFDTPGK